MDEKFTEHDIHLAEDIGRIKTLQEQILVKLDSYCDENRTEHDKIWSKLNTHGRAINRILGGVAAITALLGGVWVWLRHKVG